MSRERTCRSNSSAARIALLARALEGHARYYVGHGIGLLFKLSIMISIVYGSLEAGLPKNRAALVGCHGRNLHPIFANWLNQRPTLPLPLFTCHVKVAILSNSLFLTW
jgi:hypothetical protein